LEGGPKEGKWEFSLEGGKLRGVFVIFRMKGKKKEWLLIKKKDGLEERGFELKPVIKKK
jgi:hypothetical protein